MNRIQTLALAARSSEARAALAAAPGLADGDRDLLEAFLALVDGDADSGCAALGRLDADARAALHGVRLAAALRSLADAAAAGADWDTAVRRCPEVDAVDARPWDESDAPRLRSFVFGAHQLFVEACVIEGRLGRMDRAEATAALAFVYWSDRGQLLNTRGFLESLRGNVDASLALFEAAVEAAPDDPRAHIALAYHWSAGGERERAEAAVERALARAPRYADLHYQMGLLKRAGSDLEGALAATQAALSINPNYMVARLEEAELLFALERWEAARDAYRSVLAAGLRSSDMHLRLGQIEDHLGNLEGARDAYEAARTLNPQDPLVHYYMGKFHQRRGDRDHAVDAWKRFIVLGEERQTTGTPEDPSEDGE
jgi:tetratricopeptide (TPR) repeat protein